MALIFLVMAVLAVVALVAATAMRGSLLRDTVDLEVRRAVDEASRPEPATGDDDAADQDEPGPTVR